MTAARERRPDDAIRVDVDAARRVAHHTSGRIVERRLVHFANAGLRIDAENLAWHWPGRRAPHTAVRRMRDDAVDHTDGERAIDSGIDLPVLVDVVIAATPALRCSLITCFVEDLVSIQPMAPLKTPLP